MSTEQEIDSWAIEWRHGVNLPSSWKGLISDENDFNTFPKCWFLSEKSNTCSSQLLTTCFVMDRFISANQVESRYICYSRFFIESKEQLFSILNEKLHKIMETK